MSSIGPYTVSMPSESSVEVNLTLFNFLSSQTLYQLSKKKLRECFTEGFVILNGKTLSNGFKDERLIVNEGDIVEIRRDCKRLEARQIESIAKTLTVVYFDEHIGVVEKPAGISVGNGSIFDRSAKLKLKMVTGIDYYEAVYHLRKGMHGLMIYALNQRIMNTLINGLFNIHTDASISLQYTCLLCGYIGEPNTMVTIQSDYKTCKKFDVAVIQTSRSTSTEYLSLVNIRPNFSLSDSKSTSLSPEGSTTGHARYFSSYLKYIKNALKSRGYPVVGDAHMVKRSKGVFESLLGIHISAGIFDSSEKRLSIDIPSKYFKVISREQQYWERNKLADLDKLSAWNKLRDQVKSDLCMDNSSSSDSSSEAGDHKDLDDKLDEGVPIEYITSEANFCEEIFHVTPDVMIPRKSSETVVREAVRCYWTLSRTSDPSSVRVLDMGTGSGCLLLSILRAISKHLESSGIDKHRMQSLIRGLGIDLAPAALQVALINSKNLKLDHLIEFQVLDFANLEELQASNDQTSGTAKGLFDIVVCNPPYSSQTEHHRLSTRRKVHEPSLALFAPTDPLGCYRTIAASIRRCLSNPCRIFHDGCFFIFEVGHGQHLQVIDIMSDVPDLVYVNSCIDHKSIIRSVTFQVYISQ